MPNRRFGYLHLLFLAGLGKGEQHHKKSEQQGDEVGIGDHPAILADDILRRSILMPRSPSPYAGRPFRKPDNFDLEHTWIHALENGDHAFQHHLAALRGRRAGGCAFFRRRAGEEIAMPTP